MGSLRSWRPTPSRRSTSRVASGTCSPGPSLSYVATAACSPSPSGGSEKADPGLPRFRVPGEPNAGHGGALRTHLCGPPDVPRRALLSLPKAPAPASPPASHRRGGPPHRSLPDAGVTYREHSADVGPLLEAADQLQARKGDRGREGTEHTRDTELWGIYNTSRCPRSRNTRRDTLPHSLRFVRHKPWLFRFGALHLLRGLVVILSVGYPSVILSFLPFCLLFVVLVCLGCWCVGKYYQYI